MVKFFFIAAVFVVFIVSIEAFKPQKMIFKDGGMDKKFLKTLDKESKEKYLAIVKNKNLTKAQVETQLDALVATLTPEQKDKYNALKQSRQDHMNKLKAKVAEMMPTFSSETQKVIRELEAILEDKNLTCAETHERLQQIKNSSPKKTQNELRKIFRSLKGGKKGGSSPQEGRFDAQKNKVENPFNNEFEGTIVDAVL
uniref:SXP/RAL-2 family protein Ani s 5-like cation-binding domain-containing protein n=1 Tax=Panagrolaimus sp. PS1159 TaxID=55785 RepID=A0AC35FS93_9BILA